MPENFYVIEHMIRERLADARGTAKVAALLRQQDQGRPRSNGLGTRLVHFRGFLGKAAREAAFETARALRSWTGVTKRS
jgi:hypothetical protein